MQLTTERLHSETLIVVHPSLDVLVRHPQRTQLVLPTLVEEVRSLGTLPGELSGLLDLLLQTLLFLAVRVGAAAGAGRRGAVVIIIIGQGVLHPGVLVSNVGGDHPGLLVLVEVEVVLAILLLVDGTIVDPVYRSVDSQAGGLVVGRAALGLHDYSVASC